MTEPPEYPGHETRIAKADVAGAQAALDATFNAVENGEADDVEARLRQELHEAGVDDLSDEWVTWSADRIRAGSPVIAEVDES
jgi:hypothetical protein